jgi:hypothetical protein
MWSQGFEEKSYNCYETSREILCFVEKGVVGKPSDYPEICNCPIGGW